MYNNDGPGFILLFGTAIICILSIYLSFELFGYNFSAVIVALFFTLVGWFVFACVGIIVMDKLENR